MKLHRFIGNFDWQDSQIRIVDKEILKQVRNVLRLKVGEQIILADGQGQEAIAEIKELGKDFLVGKILSQKANDSEPSRKAILYCAVLKKENFEWVAQKATEVGVAAIVPLLCERTVKTGLKIERLEKIIKEAAEQSGRGVLPKISESTEFSQAIKQAERNELNLFFDLSGSESVVSDVVKSKHKTIGLFIGPEGGWSDFELDLVRQRKFDCELRQINAPGRNRGNCSNVSCL